MLENIEYLSKKQEFRIGDVKNLAVAINQKNDMAKMYPKTNVSSISNADMLSQNFGSLPEVQNQNTPVKVSAIPNVQNSFNMESKPVDLNVNPVTIEPVPNLNIPTINNMNVSSMDNSNNIPVIEPINVNNNGDASLNSNSIDSGFKVSNEPNIFDNPINSISQEEINKPVEPVVSDNGLEVEGNIFSQSNLGSSNFQSISDNKENNINDDIIMAQIAIEENNVKNFEALAENSKKKIELLKRQLKKKENDFNIENTASNLFNNNGLLDEEKVLGKTPIPNIMAA